MRKWKFGCWEGGHLFRQGYYLQGMPGRNSELKRKDKRAKSEELSVEMTVLEFSKVCAVTLLPTTSFKWCEKLWSLSVFLQETDCSNNAQLKTNFCFPTKHNDTFCFYISACSLGWGRSMLLFHRKQPSSCVCMFVSWFPLKHSLEKTKKSWLGLKSKQYLWDPNCQGWNCEKYNLLCGQHISCHLVPYRIVAATDLRLSRIWSGQFVVNFSILFIWMFSLAVQVRDVILLIFCGAFKIEFLKG